MKKKVLFHRHFRRFQGGHLAFWHYYLFLKGSDKYEPQIYFSKESLWDTSNPWLPEREKVLTQWAPHEADILMLGIVDWTVLSENERNHPPCPIVHPVLHSRIADPADPAHATLRHRAIRICPSEETAEAIRNTGKVNGPVFIIPHGIEISNYPKSKPFEKRSIELLIAGLKNPDLAREIGGVLKSSFKKKFPSFKEPVQALTDLIPQDRFLKKLSDAKTTLFLPNPKEGFYRPILEGMALETLCLSPIFLGKSELYKNNVNYFSCEYNPEKLVELCRNAAYLDRDKRDQIILAGKTTVAESSTESQKNRFLEILDHVDEIW